MQPPRRLLLLPKLLARSFFPLTDLREVARICTNTEKGGGRLDKNSLKSNNSEVAAS